MTTFIFFPYLDQLSDLVSIFTPIILLLWFYYSQKQILSKNYYDEVDGTYAGFVNSDISLIENKTHAGIIMNIRDIDSKGYFKGELDFAEVDNEIRLKDGIHTFFGKLDYGFYINKSRHPFKPSANRVYKGSLYIVSRLDFLFESYKIENYLISEYDIVHYREMQTLKFILKKNYREDSYKLPHSFILYKSAGFDFEPYNMVKQVVFRGETRVDT